MQKYSLIKNSFIDSSLVSSKRTKTNNIELSMYNIVTRKIVTYGYICRQVARRLNDNYTDIYFVLCGKLCFLVQVDCNYSKTYSNITILFRQVP